MLIDVPPAPGPQKLVQLADMLRLVRNAAEAEDGDDAVDGAGLDAAFPLLPGARTSRGGRRQILYADRHDLVYVLQPRGLDGAPQRRVVRGVRLDAVDAGDLSPGAALRAPRGIAVACHLVLVPMPVGEHVDPETAAGPDLQHDARDAGVGPRGRIQHVALGRAPVEERELSQKHRRQQRLLVVKLTGRGWL